MNAAIIPWPNGECSVLTRFRDPVLGDGRFAFRFPDLAAARAFCVACDFSWSVTATPLELKPPRGPA